MLDCAAVFDHKSILARRGYPPVHARTDAEQINAPDGYGGRCLRYAVAAVSGSRRLSAEWVLRLPDRPGRPPSLNGILATDLHENASLVPRSECVNSKTSEGTKHSAILFL